MGSGASQGRSRYGVKTVSEEGFNDCEDSYHGGGSTSSRLMTASQSDNGRLLIGSQSEAGRARCSPSVGKRLWNLFSKAEELKGFKPHVEFLRVIASPATNLDQYLETIIDEVIRCTDADRCSVYFVDEIRRQVWCVGSTECPSFRLSWDRGIVGESARDGRLLNLSDVHSHTSFDNTVERSTGYLVQTMLTLPIKHMVDEGRSIGVIQVLNKKDGVFTDHDESELAAIAMVISDSFYRQRWRAFEKGVEDDSEALAIISAHDQEKTSRTSRTRHVETGVTDDVTDTATQRFAWSASPLSWTCGAAEKDESETEEVPTIAIPSRPLSGPGISACRRLRTSDFDALSCSPEDLVFMVPFILEDTGCVRMCRVAPELLRNWSWAARRLYRDANPYHNWYHGFAVLQHCYFQVITTSVRSQLRYLDVFGLLVAALTHDLDHPGVNNGYLVREEDELALRYNDMSVLENHHAYLSCELLRKDESAIGSGLAKAEQQQLRKVVIKSILDTDMAHHRDLCEQVMLRKNEGAEVENEDRQFWSSLCVHTADLCTQCLPWSVALSWEARVSREFLQQAEAELARGLTPAPFMHFDFDDVKQRGKLQLNFIDFVLLPMWDPYTQLLHELRPLYDNLVSNRAMYDYRAVHGEDSKEDVERPLEI